MDSYIEKDKEVEEKLTSTVLEGCAWGEDTFTSAGYVSAPARPPIPPVPSIWADHEEEWETAYQMVQSYLRPFSKKTGVYCFMCRNFDWDETTWDKTVIWGRCRRFPPSIAPPASCPPLVHGEDYCMEFVSDEEIT